MFRLPASEAAMLCLLTCLIETVRTHAARARVMRDLSGLSERELADIGLSRGDILRVARGVSVTF
jgi:uncharacterized protein YjiS (DUF1127 family)